MKQFCGGAEGGKGGGEERWKGDGNLSKHVGQIS